MHPATRFLAGGCVRAAVLAWLESKIPHVAIAATLTFDPKRGSGHKNIWAAQRAFRQFCWKLNRALFGNAAARYGKGLTIIPVIEGGGATGKHYHYHVLIEVPHFKDESDVRGLIEALWRSCPGAGQQMAFKSYESIGWVRYMLKNRDKPNLLDAIDYCNLSFTR